MASFFRSAKSLTNLYLGKNKYVGDSQLTEEDGSLYDKEAKNIDSEDIKLNQFYGNVSLVTNVACQCGFTKPAYTELEKFSQAYHDNGLRFLLFPSNEFFGQEPGTPAEIKDFVKDGYPKLDSVFLEKSEVNGAKTNDVYKYLKKAFPGDITWNFATKFVIGKDGIPVKRFDKNDGWKVIESCIKDELAKDYKSAQNGVAPSEVGADSEQKKDDAHVDTNANANANANADANDNDNATDMNTDAAANADVSTDADSKADAIVKPGAKADANGNANADGTAEKQKDDEKE